MTHGSLFSGIGGFDLGFERAGIETIWQVEIDPYCRRVLERHWPNALRFEDIRLCGAHNLSPVDILSGGFPCQDISNAGKRAGIDGERSRLWSEYARIIGELRPRFVVVENVAALLGRGMGRVLGDLAAIGYDAEWDCISAADAGANHLRERIWIVAYPNGAGSPSERNGLPRGSNDTVSSSSSAVANADSGGLGASRQSEAKAESADCVITGRELGTMAHTQRSRLYERHINQAGQITRRSWKQYPNWKIEPDVGRVAHGVPARVDRLRGLGNAIVPQISQWIGERIVECERQRESGKSNGNTCEGQGSIPQKEVAGTN